MTDEEKKEYKETLVKDCMTYSHIDYDDDKNIIEIMVEATMQELSELIPDFDPYNMTSRQRLLTMSHVNELYEKRDKYQEETKTMTNTISSMLLKEMYKGGTS